MVAGKVQGVGYRQATLEQADRLELDGWVRNVAGGEVEVLFEGEEGAVRELAAWLERGPRGAKVKGVSVTEQPLQGIAGFIVRR